MFLFIVSCFYLEERLAEHLSPFGLGENFITLTQKLKIYRGKKKNDRNYDFKVECLIYVKKDYEEKLKGEDIGRQHISDILSSIGWK